MAEDRQRSGDSRRRSSSGRKSNPEEQQLAKRRFRSKSHGFVCTLPLRNQLPSPAPAPKLIQLPTDLQQFVEYRSTSLDTDYTWQHHVEKTVGVRVDLVDPDLHHASQDKRVALHPDDLKLLKWDAAVTTFSTPEDSKDHAWLKKPVFMANDLTQATHVTAKRELPEFESSGNEADEFVRAALRSFEMAQKTPKHVSKPTLQLEWSIPILPDSMLWANDYAMVGFEEDPAAKYPSKRPRLERAMLVNAKHDSIPNQHKEILKGTIIIPRGNSPSEGGSQVSEDFEFLKEYQIARMQTERNYLVFLNEGEQTATFTEHRQAKIELRSGIATSAESEDVGASFQVARRNLTTEEKQERSSRQATLRPHPDFDSDAEAPSDPVDEGTGQAASASGSKVVDSVSDESGHDVAPVATESAPIVQADDNSDLSEMESE